MIQTHGMRFGAYRIRVAPLPAIVALILLGVMLSAGFWQLDRAEEKRRLAVEQAYRGAKKTLALEPALLTAPKLEQLRHRRASASGRYRSDKQYLLDNRTHKHVAGYHVLTPLRLQGGDVHVLVNRGWLPVGPDRGQLPDLAVAEQSLTEEGLIVAPPASGLVLGSSGYDEDAWPRVVQQVNMARIEEQLGAPLLPFVLRLGPDSGHGYAREWQVHTGLSPERHVGYAVQWFALTVALVALCTWAAVGRVPEDEHAP